MRNTNFISLSSSDITGSPASAAIDANQLFACSVQGVVAGSSPVGALKIQASNDVSIAGNLETFVPTNWTDIGMSAQVSVSGAGTVLIPKIDLSYRWIRIVFTFTSGTGTITAKVNASGY